MVISRPNVYVTCNLKVLLTVQVQHIIIVSIRHVGIDIEVQIISRPEILNVIDVIRLRTESDQLIVNLDMMKSEAR